MRTLRGVVWALAVCTAAGAPAAAAQARCPCLPIYEALRTSLGGIGKPGGEGAGSQPVLAASERARFPADCVGFLEVERFGQVLAKSAGLMRMVQPGLTLDLLKEQVGRHFGNPGMLGVDMERGFGLVLLNPKRYADPVVCLAPVSDPQLYLGGVGQLLQSQGKKGGVHIFSKRVFDVAAYRTATPSERRDISAFYRTHTRAVLFFRQHAITCSDAAACKRVRGWLESGRLDFGTRVSGQMRGAVDAVLFREVYAEQMARRAARAKQRVGAKFARGETREAGADTVDTSRLLGLQIHLMMSLFEELDDIHFGADLALTGLRARVSLLARRDAPLAPFLEAQSASTEHLLDMVPADAVFALSQNLKSTAGLVKTGANVLEHAIRVQTGEGLSEPQRKQVQATLAEYARVYGGVMAFAWLAPGSPKERAGYGMELMELFKIKDPGRARAFWALTAAGRNPIKELYKDLGMSFSLKVREGAFKHRGVAIDDVEIVLDGKKLPKASVDSLLDLFGGKLSMKFAFLGSRMAACLGPHSLERMHQIIGLAAGKGDSLAETKAFRLATLGLPKDANVILFVSMARLADWSEPRAGGPPVPMMEKRLGIGLTGRVVERSFVVDLFAPMQELLAAARVLRPRQVPRARH